MFSIKNLVFIIGIVFVFYLFIPSNESEPIQKQLTPYLIINAVDASGSAKGKDWPWPTRKFYQDEVLFLEQNGGGVLAVFNFSNPIATPISVTILAKKNTPNVYKGESAVRTVRNYNDSIMTENQRQLDMFWSKMEKTVIDYIPSKDEDYTYVEAHLSGILKLVKMPYYQNYHKFALIYSDLVNDVPKGTFSNNIDSKAVIRELNQLNVQIGLCSYTLDSIAEEIDVTSLTSYRDFVVILKAHNDRKPILTKQINQ